MSPSPAKPADGVAWITGASSGIGRETAKRLAAAGWMVVATARGADALASLAAEGPAGRIVAMPGDITDAPGMAAIVARIEAEVGPLALVILNAGTYQPLDGKNLDAELIRRTFHVNVDGTVNALVPAAAAMKPRGKGQIAIVASVAGYGGLPKSAAYGATKAALINMAASLKFDFDRLGILMQVINPGFVETPLTDQNEFEMPFLMKVDAAADRILSGLATTRFEIVFPRRFALILKFLNILPYRLYFPLVGRMTKAQ
jgi:NAD(P)-dependent dehydrogenase (short-subunit alcohol dehydrogenase family)